MSIPIEHVAYFYQIGSVFLLLGHVSSLRIAVGQYMIMGRWGRAAKARANEWHIDTQKVQLKNLHLSRLSPSYLFLLHDGLSLERASCDECLLPSDQLGSILSASACPSASVFNGSWFSKSLVIFTLDYWVGIFCMRRYFFFLRLPFLFVRCYFTVFAFNTWYKVVGFVWKPSYSRCKWFNYFHDKFTDFFDVWRLITHQCTSH